MSNKICNIKYFIIEYIIRLNLFQGICIKMAVNRRTLDCPSYDHLIPKKEQRALFGHILDCLWIVQELF